jgi:NitT/TauT family transport system substrate-binding protein
MITACTGTQLTTAPLPVSYMLWSGSFPMVIAQEKGFFAQQGLQVAAKLDDSATATDSQIAAFVAGKLSGALMPLGDAINISTNNPDIRIVAVVDKSDGADAIVAQPSIHTVADIKGKRLGAKLGSFSELFVTEMLKANGLTPDDVTLINTAGEQVPDRLQSSELQAGHTWEPFISRSVMAQGNVVFTSHQTPGLIPDVLVFSSEVLRDRPQDIKAFIRAWFQAVEYWKANPQAGSALIAKTLKLDPRTVALAGIKLLDRAENLQAFQPGQTHTSIYYTAQLYSDFLGQTGSIRRPAEINTLLDSSFLGD